MGDPPPYLTGESSADIDKEITHELRLIRCVFLPSEYHVVLDSFIKKWNFLFSYWSYWQTEAWSLFGQRKTINLAVNEYLLNIHSVPSTVSTAGNSA